MKRGLDIVKLDNGVRVDFPGCGAVVVTVLKDKVVINASNHITKDEDRAEINLAAPADK